MSDRFVLNTPKEEIETLFSVSSKRDDYFEPNYNITPGSLRPIIVKESEERALVQAQWGLIPPDADEERAGKKHFEYKAEKAGNEEWIADGLKHRRCLVPANGFYKWKSSQKETTPFYIRLLSNRLTAFAGIYGVWKSSSGRDVYSFAILTTKANTLVEPVDDRMPVLLQRTDFDTWLGSNELADKEYEDLALKPYPLTEMAVNRVSKKVNDINDNGPELIQPIPK